VSGIWQNNKPTATGFIENRFLNLVMKYGVRHSRENGNPLKPWRLRISTVTSGFPTTAFGDDKSEVSGIWQNNKPTATGFIENRFLNLVMKYGVRHSRENGNPLKPWRLRISTVASGSPLSRG
jgi:hypothetical protein